MIDDEHINSLFWNKPTNRINRYIIKRLSTEELEYLSNRYTDSENIYETIYRIKYNITEHPKCPVCGKPVKYLGRPNSIGLFSNHCSTKCSSLDLDVITIRKNTSIKEYNNPNYNNSEKTKQTCLEKYGVVNVLNIPYIRKKNITETHSTTANNKRTETCLRKYGYTSNLTYLHKNGLFDYTILKSKEINTKKKNNTLNTSQPEEEYYNILKLQYTNVIRQYTDERYPFCCDFYIPDKDLFIECNFHWTHGGKPFEGTDEDLQKLQDWCNKNTEYYNNAIDTWCIRDVNKRKIAKENKLNYIEIWK